jgi:hypothetical protein
MGNGQFHVTAGCDVSERSVFWSCLFCHAFSSLSRLSPQRILGFPSSQQVR